MTSRGIRNNNPGNIRRSSDDWKGLSVAQTDDDFFTFTTPHWGIRALGKILLNYQRKHKHMDIAHMISRWAPPNENDTTAYIKAVCNTMEVRPFDYIELKQARNLLLFVLMVQAIIQYENGEQPYTNEQIERALRAI